MQNRIVVSSVLLAAGLGLGACTVSMNSAKSTTSESELAQAPPPRTTPAPAAGNTANGQTVFTARCAACHSVSADGKSGFTGPNLHGVIGRKAGSLGDFAYSSALKDSNITWASSQVKNYLAGPPQLVPGTKMGFVGPTDPQDINDIIAFLGGLR